jgi:hypothetical protein
MGSGAKRPLDSFGSGVLRTALTSHTWARTEKRKLYVHPVHRENNHRPSNTEEINLSQIARWHLNCTLKKYCRNHLQKSIRVSSTLTQKITQNYEKKDVGYPII